MSVNLNDLYAVARLQPQPPPRPQFMARKAPPRQANQMGLDAFSLRFFLEGEEQEANGYKNVVLDDGVRASPDELSFDSFDTIPKKRLPLLVITGLSTVVAFLVAGWMVTGGVSAMHPWQGVASRQAVDSGKVSPAIVDPPVFPARSLPVVPAPPPISLAAGTVAAIVPERSHAVAGVPAARNLLGVRSVSGAQGDRRARALGTTNEQPASSVEDQAPAESADPDQGTVLAAKTSDATEGNEPDAKRAPDSRLLPRDDQPIPLHGYVWSPASKSLVPLEGPESNAPPSTRPSDEVGAAPSETLTPSDAVLTPPSEPAAKNSAPILD
jgi:hypothetical protein